MESTTQPPLPVVKRRSIASRLLRLGLGIVALLVITAGLSGWWAIQQTAQVPEFYRQAQAQLPAKIAEASQRLQSDVERLQDDAAKRGSWRAAFSDAEINAWLLQELPKKFPKLLAQGASDPRVMIQDDLLLAAVRYQNHHIDTVISCEFSVALTEQPNMLAVRVANLRAGALPLPLGQFQKAITREAARGELDIRWDDTEQGPVALVNVPSEHPNYVQKSVVVESVQLIAGQLLLAGHTGAGAHQSFRPQGAVHRFVSYRNNDKHNCQTSRVASRRKSARVR